MRAKLKPTPEALTVRQLARDAKAAGADVRISMEPPKPSKAAAKYSAMEMRFALKTAAAHYGAALLSGDQSIVGAAYFKLEDAAVAFNVFHKQER